jgi:photosystem II stability/assembly factor-like uncharacterized protein
MKSSAIAFSATFLVAATFARFAAAADAFAVFKSSDHGRSWMRSDAGMPGQSRFNAFGSVDGVLFAGTDSGIYISRDEALSWQPATGAAMSSGRIISFATLGRRVFAGTDGNGLLVSSDGGASWTLERTFPSKKVRCLLAHDGKVYAGTDANGVFAFNDAGQFWSHLSAGLPSHAQVFALSAVRGKLFAGLYSRGLYAWDEQKQSWAKTGPVTPLALASNQDTLIAGHNPGGLYWSGDLGASWSKGVAESHGVGPSVSLLPDDSGELSSEAPVWELGADDGLVCVGASAGIYYSKDRGRTWTRARRGLPEKSPGIAFLLKRDFVLAGALIRDSNDEQDGAANGSQPIRSETSRTSSAAGSRR